MSGKQGRIQALLAVAAVGLVGLCAAAAPARAAALSIHVGAVSEPAKTQKFDSAKAQFEHATSLKKAVRGAEGEARERALAEAVAAYRAVREYFGKEAHVCAEAAFRAGELLRTADDFAGALIEFGVARDRGAGTDFRVRAMLEIGHLERRMKHPEAAISAYESVIEDDSASRRHKDDAMLWLGRVYADLERFADARRLWQKVADKGDDPMDRIQAFDQIASVLIETGDLEGAAGTIKRCNEALSEVAQEETKLGERVRASLTAMRSIQELTRAIEKRKRSEEKPDAPEGVREKPAKKKE